MGKDTVDLEFMKAVLSFEEKSVAQLKTALESIVDDPDVIINVMIEGMCVTSHMASLPHWLLVKEGPSEKLEYVINREMAGECDDFQLEGGLALATAMLCAWRESLESYSNAIGSGLAALRELAAERGIAPVEGRH
jgi:hypothetical protein